MADVSPSSTEVEPYEASLVASHEWHLIVVERRAIVCPGGVSG